MSFINISNFADRNIFLSLGQNTKGEESFWIYFNDGESRYKTRIIESFAEAASRDARAHEVAELIEQGEVPWTSFFEESVVGPAKARTPYQPKTATSRF